MKIALYLILNFVLGAIIFALLGSQIASGSFVGLIILLIVSCFISYKSSRESSKKFPKYYYLWGVSFIALFLLFSFLSDDLTFRILLIVVSAVLYATSIVGGISGKKSINSNISQNSKT